MKKRVILPVLLLAAALGCGWALWDRGTPLDPDAQPSGGSRLSQEEWQEYLQQEAEASSFRFLVNTAIVVGEDGQADLLLENSADNRDDLQAVLTLSDGREIYRSAVLAPGGQQLAAEPSIQLSPGVYPALVTVQALDRETGQVTGQAELDVTVTVREP